VGVGVDGYIPAPLNAGDRSPQIFPAGINRPAALISLLYGTLPPDGALDGR
jgi:hypothetical protein